MRHPPEGTILIVEDDPFNREILSKILDYQGFTVCIALSGEDALTQLAQISVDLILLDVMMVGLDGFETCEKIKQNPDTCEIPVIFMTALSNAENKVRGLEIGAVDYITKPFHPAEVIARVKVHLSLRATTQALQAEIERHKQTVKKLEKANHALYRLANLDGLTQVANRYCFDESLTEEWFRLAREKQPIGIVLCDVDHFKVYNDHYGHQAGDECLRQIARAIYQSARRPADLVARYGGEEFVVLLPTTGRGGVEHVASTICNAIRNLQIPHAQSDSDSCVTISVGGCSLVPDVSMPPNTLVELADKALYQAKSQGRNQYVLSSPVYDYNQPRHDHNHQAQDTSLRTLGNNA